ncbi:oxidoreductase, FAD-binding protein [Legionella steelei]|uniref:Oxidoreductase, FAD-binding protein n=4 Tax=Legionella TaxID=445 RepID=A0A0W0ZS19_9GAMM|nr:2Fe-2S iron-sulfur cluster-binding protein [Legionella steelei]KTD71758.1 oxidoreductase, FAD-binding protein [Legionella steelei]
MKWMPNEKGLPTSMSRGKKRDVLESNRLHATLHSPCIFGCRIAMKVTSLIMVMIMGITPSSVFALSPAEHAAHHQSSNSTTSTLPPISTTPTPTNATTQSSEHAAHHKGGAGGNMMAPSSAKPGPAGCCGEMATGGKPFYASLMDFPELTDEARQYIRNEAVARLGLGVQIITAIQTELHRALSTNDPAAAQTALKQVREGLSFAASGASALQALNETQPPPQIALTWFKREMNIEDNMGNEMNGGFRDLSWLHWMVMFLLVAALMMALLVQRARHRRINSLIQRLTPGSEPVKPSTSNSPKPPELEASPPKTEPPAPIRWSGILRTTAIFDETPNVKTFRLMEPNLGQIPFTFLPGQYATITSVINGQKIRRCYTISSSPTQHDYIELTVKREQYGVESRHLHDHINTGDLLEVSAPAGEFFFTGKEANGIVLIAGGVGITPMMSVLRYLTDRSYPKDIHLLYAANSPTDIIFREECTHLARRHPNVSVDVIVQTTNGADWTGPVGFITPDFIEKAIPDIVHHRIHLCGPVPMMDAVKAALLQLKIPSEQVKTEHFAPPKGGPVFTTEPPIFSSTAKTPEAPTDVSPMMPPSAHATINFSKSNKSGPLAPNQSVLEAAEALGVFIDFECRTGICGRCKVHLLEGSVNMEVDDALSTDEKAAGVILACQAKSPSDLVVEA